jgi:hypothetical protein
MKVFDARVGMAANRGERCCRLRRDGDIHWTDEMRAKSMAFGVEMERDPFVRAHGGHLINLSFALGQILIHLMDKFKAK